MSKNKTKNVKKNFDKPMLKISVHQEYFQYFPNAEFQLILYLTFIYRKLSDFKRTKKLF